MTSDKKFVVLRGLEHGNVFWSSNKPDNDPRFLANGEEAYEVLLFTNDEEEAKSKWKEKSGFGFLVDLFNAK